MCIIVHLVGTYTCKGLFEIEKEGSIWTPDVTTSKQMKQLGRLTITQFETIETCST